MSKAKQKKAGRPKLNGQIKTTSSVAIDVAVKQKVNAYCEKEKISFSQLVNLALSLFFGKSNAEKKISVKCNNNDDAQIKNLDKLEADLQSSLAMVQESKQLLKQKKSLLSKIIVATVWTMTCGIVLGSTISGDELIEEIKSFTYVNWLIIVAYFGLLPLIGAIIIQRVPFLRNRSDRFTRLLYRNISSFWRS